MPSVKTTKLRHARAQDAKALHALKQAIYQEDNWFVGDGPPSEGMIARRIRSLDSNKGLYLIAEQNQKPCAWLELHCLQARKLSHVAALTLAVKASCRQQGVGTKLLEQALSWAEQACVYKIALNVRAGNEAAIKLYEKLGFELEGREKNHIKLQQGFEDNIIMAKFLNS